MQLDGLFSTTVNLLGKSVDLRARNQNLIAANIANAETPNYIPKSLSFDAELQGAIKNRSTGRLPSSTPHPRHIPLHGASSGAPLQSVTGTVIETPAKTPGKDGNAVELENEMGRMAENQIMFNASVQLLVKKFEGLKSALREGK
ncbi:MAG TPA: flagellar basal body rod protein FlgB [Desulfuromonadales bacterium]|nr:flagellar basal body rod protein FlgB [Desulfuromonadales bacterium]